MRRKTILSTMLLLAILPAAVRGATLIESRSGDGAVNRIWIDGGRMRVDVGGAPGYMLVDTDAGRMYSVNPLERAVVDLTPSPAPGGRAPRPAVEVVFEEKGDGPRIAGYATTRYVVTAKGETCSVEYLSREAMNEIGAYEVLRKVDQLSTAGLDETEMADMDPCTLAMLDVDRHYAEKGFPVRIEDVGGNLRTELVRIDRKATVPPPGFEIPAEYRSLDPETMGEEEPAPPAAPEEDEELQRMIEQLRRETPPQK